VFILLIFMFFLILSFVLLSMQADLIFISHSSLVLNVASNNVPMRQILSELTPSHQQITKFFFGSL
jgi:hypothetical protein